jgi:uncharacterized protein YjiS (DUF1127 family)
MPHYTDRVLSDRLLQMANQLHELADRLYDHSSQLEEDAAVPHDAGRTVNRLTGGVCRVQRMMREEIEALLEMDAEQLKTESNRRYREATPSFHPQTPNRET